MKNKKSNFRGKVSKDAQKQQRAATSYGHLLLPKGASVFNAEPGSRVKLDFLPYEVTDPKHPDRDPESDIATPGSLWYKRPYKLHRNVGSTNDSHVCLTSVGKKCPICEYRAKRIKEGADKEETDTMRASLRNLYVVVPLDDKKAEAKPHIMDISQFLFQNLLNEELEENKDYEVFPDLEEGYTLKVRFDSKTIGKGQPFAEADRIDFLERTEAYTDAILDDVPNLDTVLKVLTYEELSDKFFELEGEEKGGELKEAKEDAPARARKPKEEPVEEEDKPVTRIRKPKEEEVEEAPVRTRKPKEEEVEEPPTRTRRATPPVEEDEPPVRTTRRSAPVETDKAEKCPSGHKFGKDTDRFDECDSCTIWDACMEEKEK